MKQNIGICDALIRITIGFVLLAWTGSKCANRHTRDFPLIAGLIGALKVAEGITRFCPVIYLVQKQKGYKQESPNEAVNPS
ncbi:hypothetical protein AJ85_00715 [Alkalihalobacillus alcalophilus ATCC 27647 = CGMCC 1.3604]|uniref:Inner membrane protein YgaP-like transmembrane domain-containing protein n=1 Tax=Alkalihalobacillus alcalophilus ATCC 27647 = CGMCC 1.3604 TaxID=1218173 RepID=A0A094X9Q8_ALKAL|nr:DUF2892 domain-containing protein [Alkalihalobacillus alcalophilus]KGA95510.1 hypothetical protein BALCAV_0222175 [Alkalihalobacillus alcalophilus ATCC 27647 = CGMCC 1.3604]MED1563307.1 DUF2892 domain-containing protein [Alkalihalobacillus alcalophilus]THG88696.1 hypothetical protein AJ85_00715 [Alkalihalobacillus alcalophilus ATCC 27647 = CGMCC 1.3604]